MDEIFKMRPSPIISGVITIFYKIVILFHTFFIILFVYHNPIVVLKVLKAMLETGRKFHGRSEILKYARVNKRLFWTTDIPGWGSKAYKTFILNACNRHVPFKSVQDNLQTVIFSITNKCPLACEHCFEWDNLDSKEYLQLEKLKLIQTKIQDAGVSSIQLSGGEPLVRFDDLIELLNSCDSKTDFWLLTSGFGLSLAKAQRLRKAGLTGAYISLDHWNESDHNRFRNNEHSYKWVCEAALNCQKAGIIYGFSLCATKEFITENNLYRYLNQARTLGASFIRILEARKVGRYHKKMVELEKKQLSLLNDIYLEVNSNKKWVDYPIIVYPGFYQREIGCYGAGDRYLYIDSKGDVHACPFCQKSVGSLVTESMSVLIKRLQPKGCHKFKSASKNVI